MTMHAMISSATRAMRDAIVTSQDTPILFDYVQAKGPEGIKFDVWYANTYLPALTQQYPSQCLRRYAAPACTAYAAIGELNAHTRRDQAVHTANATPALVEHHERFIGEPLATLKRCDTDANAINAAVVYPAFLCVPQDRLAALSRWYDEEHTPILLSCPQWLMVRRFLITSATGTDFTHLALHYLADLRALQSQARDAARATPWRDHLIAQGWFAPHYRVCYRMQDV